MFHEHLFSPELPRAAHPLTTEKTVRIIKAMLVALPLVQMNKANEEK